MDGSGEVRRGHTRRRLGALMVGGLVLATVFAGCSKPDAPKLVSSTSDEKSGAFNGDDSSGANPRSLPRANVDHWHDAYGVYMCDAFNVPVSDATYDYTGIHTHGDGIIHIHPFSSKSAGKNATLGLWGETVGMDFRAHSFTLQDGSLIDDSYTCQGGAPAEVGIWVWDLDDLSGDPTVYTEDFGDVHFDRNHQAITIAVVPVGTTPPPPESVSYIAQLDPDTDMVRPDSGSDTTDTIVVDPNAPPTSVPG